MILRNHLLTRFAVLTFFNLVLLGCNSSYPPPPPAPLSAIASLSALSGTGITLAPVFDQAVTDYSATVPFATDSVDIAATTSNGNATFTINSGGNPTVSLAVGDNNVSVQVTAENGTTTRTYTIVITREPLLIDTTVGWNGAASLAPFGDGGAAETYGQTFIAPAAAPTLRRLSFWLEHSPTDMSGEDLFFSILVMAWSTDRASGPVLYESALQIITSAESSMTEYTVDTGGLILMPGQEYVAFVNADNGSWNANSTLIRVGFQNADIYADGAEWELDSGNNRNLLTSTAWGQSFPLADFVVMLAFE